LTIYIEPTIGHNDPKSINGPSKQLGIAKTYAR
jgi:hypothetical protein